MNHEVSFGQRLDEGWTKEQLMAYYALTEAQYEKVMGCLKAIRQRQAGA
jgi:hypothetical protein